jgi:CRISPR system Cascade subunit CasB
VNRSTDLERLWRTNFGASFKQLGSDDSSSVERRFVALLNSHRDDLPNRLRHAVSLLRAPGVPVDWAQLLRDIQSWDHPDRFVQVQWARSFWAPPRQDAETEDQPAERANA